MSLLTGVDSQPGSPESWNSDEASESTTKQDPRVLREIVRKRFKRVTTCLITTSQISRRERYLCAITGSFDKAHLDHLWEIGREQDIPPYVYLTPVDVVHILPFSFETFNSQQNLQVRCQTLFIEFYRPFILERNRIYVGCVSGVDRFRREEACGLKFQYSCEHHFHGKGSTLQFQDSGNLP